MARGNSAEMVGEKTFGGFMLILLFALIGGTAGCGADYFIRGKVGILLSLGAGLGAAIGMMIAQGAGIWPKKAPRRTER
jgi:hypothetical protein